MFKKILVLAAAMACTEAKSDLLALPEWTVDSKCKHTIEKEGRDITRALKDMPHDAAHEMVRKAVANWYFTVGKLCHKTSKGFYCEDNVQDQMWTAFNRMIYAVRQAGTPQAARVYNEIVEQNYKLSKCAKLV